MKIATKITDIISDFAESINCLSSGFFRYDYVNFEDNHFTFSDKLWDDFQELPNEDFIKIVKKYFKVSKEPFNPQSHYDNTNGSLYQIAKQRGWDFYQADCIKRLDRAYKKGQFKEDLQKTKDLIDLWLKEMEV